MRVLRRLSWFVAAGVISLGGIASAEGTAEIVKSLERVGVPKEAGTYFQPAATSLARDIHWLDQFILVIITAIVLLVLALLAVVIFRYNAKANPRPATFTHNSAIEVTWTVVPIVILVVIGSLSLPILLKQLRIPDSDLTIKVTGNQWFWTYEYVDEGVRFDSYMIGSPFTGGDMRLTDEVRAMLDTAGFREEEFLLATDTVVVVPQGAVVKLQVTAADVIHSWTIPSFGVKHDAVPGRLGETWFRADVAGLFFGQCSELCGKDHAYMPITVAVLPPEQYAAWLEQARVEFAAAPAPRPAAPILLAQD